MIHNKYKIKALFVIPPFSDFYSSADRLYPANAAVISKLLEKNGIRTNILDLRIGLKKKIEIPENLTYLKKYYLKDYSKFSLFNLYYNFGFTENKQQIKILKDYYKIFGIPDLILITSNFTAYRSHTINMIKSIIDSGANKSFIFIGGNDVIINENWYKSKLEKEINQNNIASYNLIIYNQDNLNDFNIRVKEIISKFGKSEEKIENNIQKENFDDLPYSIEGKEINILNRTISYYFIKKIYYYDVKNERITFSNPKKLYMTGSIMFSKGCTYRCSYCFYSAKKFNKFSYKSISNILKDLLSLKEEGFEEIHVEDDSFTIDKNRSIIILKLLIWFNKNIYRFLFDYPNGLNYHKIDYKVLNYLEKANTTKLSISLGTLNNNILKNEQRPSYIEDIYSFISIASKTKIKIQAYIIAGFPGQSLKEVIDSFLFLFENNLKIGFSPYYPVINSQDFIKFKLNNQIIEKGDDEKYFASSSLFEFENCLKTSEKAMLFKIYRILSFLQNRKEYLELNKSNMLKSIYEEYLSFLLNNNLNIDQLDFYINLNKFEIYIKKDCFKFIESFLFILFLKTKKIFILNQKVQKLDIKKKNVNNKEIYLCKFVEFPVNQEIEYFHLKIYRIFSDFIK